MLLLTDSSEHLLHSLLTDSPPLPLLHTTLLTLCNADVQYLIDSPQFIITHV